jgi:hypothetical protein
MRSSSERRQSIEIIVSSLRQLNHVLATGQDDGTEVDYVYPPSIERLLGVIEIELDKLDSDIDEG